MTRTLFIDMQEEEKHSWTERACVRALIASPTAAPVDVILPHTFSHQADGEKLESSSSRRAAAS